MKEFTLQEIFDIIDKRFDKLLKTKVGTPESKIAIHRMEALQEIKKDCYTVAYNEKP